MKTLIALLPFIVPIGTFAVGIYGKMIYQKINKRKAETEVLSEDFATLKSISNNYLESVHSVTKEMQDIHIEMVGLRAKLTSTILALEEKEKEIIRLKKKCDEN